MSGLTNGRWAIVTKAALTVVGWLVLVAAVDLALGALLGSEDEAGPQAALEAGPDGALDPSGSELDPRSESEAMAGYPWNEEYWEDFAATDGTFEYVPYIGARLGDTDLRHINSEGGVRRSYQQEGLGPDAPVVWFFGGSTMWGEGQRDLHTIPSEVARLAEDDGVAIEVVNWAQRGWVIWQEALAFERALAEEDRPDLVVFYDGTNEASTQTPETPGSQPSDEPTVYDVGGQEPDTVPEPFTQTAVVEADASLWEEWTGTSLVAGLLGAEPAAAGGIPEVDEEVVDRTLSVYERGRSLALDLADDHGVVPLFFWQPTLTNRTDHPGADRDRLAMTRRLTPPTIDITGALDEVEPEAVYIDGGHTNELGARLVAEAIWEHLAPQVGSST